MLPASPVAPPSGSLWWPNSCSRGESDICDDTMDNMVDEGFDARLETMMALTSGNDNMISQTGYI